MNKFLKIISLSLALCTLISCMAACSVEPITDKAFYNYVDSNTGSGKDIHTFYVKREVGSMKTEDFVASEKESDYVLIKVKDYGDIVAVLRSDVAPITVANFKKLTKEKFYDGTVFHRVIEGFMIQGGGNTVEVTVDENGVPDSKFIPKESPNIKGEFFSNGFENNLGHVRGVLSMARTNVKDSASSQFFIVHKDGASASNLDGDYAAFGYVLAGMDVVDAIATCQVVAADTDSPMPFVDIIIESVSFVEPTAQLP